MSRIEVVFFDVGETIVDETREYGTWADWLGVPRHTFSAVFGAVITQGGDYRETLQHFRPGFDLATERAQLAGRHPEHEHEVLCGIEAPANAALSPSAGRCSPSSRCRARRSPAYCG